MEKAFEIELDDSRIEDYDEILSRFNNWKEYKREINLNLLLKEDNKIQFDVEIEKDLMPLYVDALYSESEFRFKSLTNSGYYFPIGSCAVIKKLTFIISNKKVIKLDVIVKLLNTTWGKDIKNIIESGVELKIYQHKNISGQVGDFYFNLLKQVA